MSEQTPEKENEVGVIAYMFSNDKQAATRLFPLLKLFYDGVYKNSVGIMDAKTSEGEPVLLLVGITHEEDGTTSTVPIAKVLNEEALDGVLIPDGNGGWLEVGDQWDEVNDTKH